MRQRISIRGCVRPSVHPSIRPVLFLNVEYGRFLDAPSHPYKRVCPSVRPSVRPLVPRYFQTRTRRICAVYPALFEDEKPSDDIKIIDE